MIKKTKDYEIFTFREDNREKITNAHVKRLVESIRSRNLLRFRPIQVNAAMEITDGQHRLLAAKELGIEIYYEVQESLEGPDIIILNMQKAWGMGDYLNYYIKNNYEEYKKLAEFMKKHHLNLKVAVNITMGATHNMYNNFKKGEYVFNSSLSADVFATGWQTIDVIIKYKGNCNWIHSNRFWKALLALLNHPEFDNTKWVKNLNKMITRVAAKVSTKDYMNMLMDIYNWNNLSKINLFEELE